MKMLNASMIFHLHVQHIIHSKWKIFRLVFVHTSPPLSISFIQFTLVFDLLIFAKLLDWFFSGCRIHFSSFCLLWHLCLYWVGVSRKNWICRCLAGETMICSAENEYIYEKCCAEQDDNINDNDFNAKKSTVVTESLLHSKQAKI